MDERKFTDVVKSIASSEKDVDKVLDAARLLRHEGESRKLNAAQKMELIEEIIFAAIILGAFGWLLALFSMMR